MQRHVFRSSAGTETTSAHENLRSGHRSPCGEAPRPSQESVAGRRHLPAGAGWRLVCFRLHRQQAIHHPVRSADKLSRRAKGRPIFCRETSGRRESSCFRNRRKPISLVETRRNNSWTVSPGVLLSVPGCLEHLRRDIQQGTLWPAAGASDKVTVGQRTERFNRTEK